MIFVGFSRYSYITYLVLLICFIWGVLEISPPFFLFIKNFLLILEIILKLYMI